MFVARFEFFVLLYAVLGIVVLFVMKRLFVSKKWSDLMPREQDAAAFTFFSVLFWPVTA